MSCFSVALIRSTVSCVAKIIEISIWISLGRLLAAVVRIQVVHFSLIVTCTRNKVKPIYPNRAICMGFEFTQQQKNTQIQMHSEEAPHLKISSKYCISMNIVTLYLFKLNAYEKIIEPFIDAASVFWWRIRVKHYFIDHLYELFEFNSMENMFHPNETRFTTFQTFNFNL